MIVRSAAPSTARRCRFLRPARDLALAALLGLASCAMPLPPEPSPAVVVSLPPEPTAPLTPRRPVHPLPRPKPPVPDAEAEGDAEQTPAPPPRIEVVGLEATLVARKLGEPGSRTDSPPAAIWHYDAADCAVDVYLYRDLQSGVLTALFAELKGDDQSDQRRQSCYRRIADTAQHQRADAPVAR